MAARRFVSRAGQRAVFSYTAQGVGRAEDVFQKRNRRRSFARSEISRAEIFGNSLFLPLSLRGADTAPFFAVSLIDVSVSSRSRFREQQNSWCSFPVLPFGEAGASARRRRPRSGSYGRRQARGHEALEPGGGCSTPRHSQGQRQTIFLDLLTPVCPSKSFGALCFGRRRASGGRSSRSSFLTPTTHVLPRWFETATCASSAARSSPSGASARIVAGDAEKLSVATSAAPPPSPPPPQQPSANLLRQNSPSERRP